MQVRRKYLTVDLDNGKRALYPGLRYLVEYPCGCGKLPHHNHPGGEEYMLLRSSFHDTTFGDTVDAPCFVRYTIGSEHQAMVSPPADKSIQFTWWGMVEEHCDDEPPSMVRLTNELVPRSSPSFSASNYKEWYLSSTKHETRIMRMEAGAEGIITRHATDNHHRTLEIYVLDGDVLIRVEDGIAGRLHCLVGAFLQVDKDTPSLHWRTKTHHGATVIVKELKARGSMTWRRDASSAASKNHIG